MTCAEPWVRAVRKDTQARGTGEHSGVRREQCGVQVEPLTGSPEGVQKQQPETVLKDQIICREPAPECGTGEPWEELSEA